MSHSQLLPFCGRNSWACEHERERHEAGKAKQAYHTIGRVYVPSAREDYVPEALSFADGDAEDVFHRGVGCVVFISPRTALTVGLGWREDAETSCEDPDIEPCAIHLVLAALKSGEVTLPFCVLDSLCYTFKCALVCLRKRLEHGES